MHRLPAASTALLVTLLAQSAWSQDCTSDADCANDFVCSFDDVAIGTPPCADPQNCPEPEPVQVTGTCEHGPIRCATDTDCPSPLLCVTFEDSAPCALTDPATPCEPVVEVSKECALVPAVCTTNAECAASYECVAVPGAQSCSSGDVACPVGEQCPVPEPVCETGPDMQMCFPAHQPCATDADCASDWSCLDVVATVGEMLPWWEGVTNPLACMPPGLVAVFEERAEVDEGNSGSSTASDQAASGSVQWEEAQTDPAPTSEPTSSEGGCAVAGGSSTAAGWLVSLLLLGLGRRRRP